jgi:glycyl-tRNA synthetase
MAEAKPNERMEKIVSLCKRRGFIFQSSEVYGGINGFWDYGPLGVELKRNLKEAWWRWMTREREDVSGLDATIIMHPIIWKASGHVETFSDPMVDCLLTKKRFRADQIEPQSGTVYRYYGFIPRKAWEVASSGATVENITVQLENEELVKKLVPDQGVLRLKLNEVAIPVALHKPYAVLVPHGKPPESAHKVAKLFFAEGGDPERFIPILVGSEQVQNTQRYNPENGSLLTEARPFNLMFQSHYGPIASDENVCYLRPETAQAIFVQFKNVLDSSRQKVPFGIAQIGKAFRNEITPRNFIFRSREFEQMELEYFIQPDEAVAAVAGEVARPSSEGHPGEPQPNWGWEIWHKYWVEERIRFYEAIGLPRTSLKEYWQKPEELAHYAKATVDILFAFPFGTEELEGVAARGDFDLTQHAKFSGKSMDYFDEAVRDAWKKLDDSKKATLRAEFVERKKAALLKRDLSSDEAQKEAESEANAFFEKLAKGLYTPHVIEPSAGADRLALALISNAYNEEEVTDEKGAKETRIVMKFHPRIAPITVGVFPLLKNRPELVQKAKEIRDLLRPHMSVFYDDAGAIGRRYRRQDEAGTPFGVTIDFDTLGEKPELKDTVTLRDRDSMKQERMKIQDLLPYLLSKIR